MPFENIEPLLTAAKIAAGHATKSATDDERASHAAVAQAYAQIALAQETLNGRLLQK